MYPRIHLEWVAREVSNTNFKAGNEKPHAAVGCCISEQRSRPRPRLQTWTTQRNPNVAALSAPYSHAPFECGECPVEDKPATVALLNAKILCNSVSPIYSCCILRVAQPSVVCGGLACCCAALPLAAFKKQDVVFHSSWRRFVPGDREPGEFPPKERKGKETIYYNITSSPNTTCIHFR